MKKNLSSLFAALVGVVTLFGAGCARHDHHDVDTVVQESSEGYRVKVRAPFTHVDVYVPKDRKAGPPKVDVEYDD